ncbi:hypothetical protein HJC23_004715 [Cyclotella cryptica]|uniref:NTF2 domain-containing protein n=1 Tax=Cyclotella cryptica TaxID=29204 RepID=A0ABD3PT98_9STRA|eukprot:CCRYP_012037-RA/>CCRYP_012037-RA protein AED:0.04 eAED:0.04 QI:309/-1/1/1/-1/1/1/530/573
MSSEPSPSATPTPQAASSSGPSPEKIGKSFIKTYYKTLLTSPSQLIRFYQPDSTISRGMQPSSPTSPCSYADALSGPDPGERVRKAFFEWAGSGVDLHDDSHDAAASSSDALLRIDFERGAIDAQESLGGGILLVVTGHMYLPFRTGKPTGFVHTFFLNNAAARGKKKQFYVMNDILRFLEDDEDAAVDAAQDVGVVGGGGEGVNGGMQPAVQMEGAGSSAAVVAPLEPEDVPQPVVIETEPEIEEEPVQIPVEITDYVDEAIDYDAPAAEEEKIEIVQNLEEEPSLIEDEPAAEEEKIDLTGTADSPIDSPAASPNSDNAKRGKRNRRKKGGKSSRSNSPSDKEDEPTPDATANKEDTTEKPKTPGSWASLVATGQPKKTDDGKKGGGRRSSPKSRPQDKPVAAVASSNHDSKPPPQDRKESTPASSVTAAAAAPSAQRTPEATLFIRNVPDATKESEIRSLFEPFTALTGNKILGITLNPNRGFCFVDFDGVPAVDAVVSEAEKSLVKEARTGRKVSSSFMVHGRVLDVERKVKGDANKQPGGSGGYNRRSSRGRSGMRRSPPRGGGGGNR